MDRSESKPIHRPIRLRRSDPLSDPLAELSSSLLTAASLASSMSQSDTGRLFFWLRFCVSGSSSSSLASTASPACGVRVRYEARVAWERVVVNGAEMGGGGKVRGGV